MKTWKPILMLGLVFFAGIALGVVGTRLAIRNYLQTALAHPEKIQAAVERNLTRKLKLDAGQRSQLDDILTDTRSQLKTLRLQYQPQAVAILSQADARITKLLTPEQAARFEKIKQNSTWLQRLLHGGP